MADGSKIPKGRIRRSAKLGSIAGVQGARYAGTKAANVARSEEESKEKLEQRHLETAMKMVGALGQMKGAAMKLGRLAPSSTPVSCPAGHPESIRNSPPSRPPPPRPFPGRKAGRVLPGG